MKHSVDDYLAALDKMKKSRRDRIGVLGELGVTGLGAVAGYFAAVVLFAKTVSFFGFVFVVTTTPIGWAIGAAVVVGVLAYGVSKLVRSGSKYDTLKNRSIQELQLRVEQLRKEANRSLRREPKMRKVISSVQYLVANEYLSQEKATHFLAAIEKRHLGLDDAFQHIQQLIDEKAVALSGGSA